MRPYIMVTSIIQVSGTVTVLLKDQLYGMSTGRIQCEVLTTLLFLSSLTLNKCLG